MTILNKHLTFNDFCGLVEVLKKPESDLSPFEKEKISLRCLFQPLFNLLEELRTSGHLKYVNSPYKHRSDFINVWESFLDKLHYPFSPYNQKFFIISNLLSPAIMRQAKSASLGLISERHAFEELERKFLEGSFSTEDMSDEMCSCNYCNKPLKLFAEKWHIKVQVTNDNGWEDRKPCEYNKIHEVEIDCPSGYLLVADTYRLEEFTDVVSDIFDIERVGKERAIIDSVNTLASELDYAYLPTNNFTVSNIKEVAGIYKKENNLYLGKKTDENLLKEYDEVGFVDSSSWRISIIDKQKFIEAVSMRCNSNVSEFVDEYLWDDDITSWNFIKVEPGRYSFSFYTDSRNYNDLLNEEDAIFGLKQICSLKKIL